jgi:hypothetical protein
MITGKLGQVIHTGNEAILYILVSKEITYLEPEPGNSHWTNIQTRQVLWIRLNQIQAAIYPSRYNPSFLTKNLVNNI